MPQLLPYEWDLEEWQRGGRGICEQTPSGPLSRMGMWGSAGGLQGQRGRVSAALLWEVLRRGGVASKGRHARGGAAGLSPAPHLALL